MPAVLIHGVPDTARVWSPLRSALKRDDVVAPSLPGFGCALPPGFGETKEEYVNWIVKFIEDLKEPVDLVGHDWGCILVSRVASLRPDLIRSLAAANGPVNASYDWHALAQIWQSSKGEEWMETLNPAEFAGFMAKLGLTQEQAEETVSRIDVTMKAAILRLYRSAVTVGAEWQPDLAKVTSPTLVFWGKRDIHCPVEFAYELGKDTRA